MTFTITYAWWWIPALLTVAGLIWAIFIVDGGDGWFAGLANIFALLPVFAVSMMAWAVAGALK